jgi:acetoin utilization deacetylase AcuC-like enzyme
MKIFYSPECLRYGASGHPESPDRIRETASFLAENGYAFSAPRPCTETDLLRVHTPEIIEAVRTGEFHDADTPALPGIYEHALTSAGGAIDALGTALEGENGFSLLRPPGHHATPSRPMGFCYFNNIAVAVASHLDNQPEMKAAILDIDCHHGNGTEAIFQGWERVLFVSLHQSPLYPGTGLTSQENIINYPLPPYTGESDYLNVLDVACKQIEKFKPSFLGISAGFDTFQEDPLAQLALELATYEKIGQRISGLKLPVFIVMEGGYSRKLPQCVEAFVRGVE